MTDSTPAAQTRPAQTGAAQTRRRRSRFARATRRATVVVVGAALLTGGPTGLATARPLGGDLRCDDAAAAAAALVPTAAGAGAGPGLVDGRPDPSTATIAAWERATAARLAADPADPADRGRRVVVPVVWHITEEGPAFEQGHLRRATIRQAIAQVNRGYRGLESPEAARTRFRFELVEITRTLNHHFFRDLRWYGPNERKMKHTLHRGGPGTLNIYSALPVAGISGWASFPQEYPEAPEMDGVVIHYGVADGSVGGQGDILTHEIGHWLGLFHTFQGGCSAPGDHVDDTPYEASSAKDCLEPRDSCADLPGDDPVHNYMDYAKDVCKDQFTPGQHQRMREQWQAWRAG